MKIVILDGYTENPGDLSWDGFGALGELVVHDRTPLGDEREIARRMAGADVVITNKTPISRGTLAACPGLRYIGVLATGYNVVDVGAARERGVPVTNIPAYGTAGVAQFAIALLLELCCRVGRHDGAVRSGRWASCPDFCFWDAPLTELAGKIMGVVGFGHIGRAVGRIARALGMDVLASDPNETDEGRAVARYVALDELLSQADVLSLHCPLTPATEGLIGAAAIARMKDGVLLINNARGGLLVERDVAHALKTGKIAGAGLDVVSQEPIRPDNPLLTAPNCILTPHISWAARESRARLMDIAVENLRRFLAGRPQNVVNGL